MDQQKMGGFLRQLRKEKGLTQEQLAQRLGVAGKSVSRWETGRSMPDVDTLIELADLYGVEIRRLLEGEDGAASPGAKAAMKTVARYAAREEKQTYTRLLAAALGMAGMLLVCTWLFVGETKGLLYGVLPEALCRNVMLLTYGVAAAALVGFLRAWGFQERPTREPERTVKATVTGKEVKPGTHRAGRSKGGYSYAVYFRAEDGQTLELYAYEVEFGGLRPGAEGLLTYRGSYFLAFEETA